MKRPAIQSLFHTASLDRMAVARLQGGISWAEDLGRQQGILLWDSREAATAWAEEQWGLPVIVVEIPRGSLDFDHLEPWQDPWSWNQPYRAYCYHQAIEFDWVRWYRVMPEAHSLMPEWLQPAEVTTITVTNPQGSQPDPGLGQYGQITISTK